jgi:hypothetical protein
MAARLFPRDSAAKRSSRAERSGFWAKLVLGEPLGSVHLLLAGETRDQAESLAVRLGVNAAERALAEVGGRRLNRRERSDASQCINRRVSAEVLPSRLAGAKPSLKRSVRG